MDFFTWSDSPVRELSSIFRSLPWIRIPSAGRRSPGRGGKTGISPALPAPSHRNAPKGSQTQAPEGGEAAGGVCKMKSKSSQILAAAWRGLGRILLSASPSGFHESLPDASKIHRIRLPSMELGPWENQHGAGSISFLNGRNIPLGNDEQGLIYPRGCSSWTRKHPPTPPGQGNIPQHLLDNRISTNISWMRKCSPKPPG